MMPLIVKNYTWRQTKETLGISVHVNGVRAHKTSFVTADNYIRLHCHPNYFEVFLWACVDDVHGKCTLIEEDNLVIFELQKVEAVDWPSLEVDVQCLSRPDKHAIRTRAVELSQKRTADEISAGLARREANKELSIREQLRIDAESRERVALIRTFECESAMKEFNQLKIEDKTKSQSGIPVPLRAGKVVEGSESKALPGIPQSGNSEARNENTSHGSNSKPKRVFNSAIGDRKETNGKRDAAMKAPPIRIPAKIAVAFTPREFPTPSRESTAVQEEEWLMKQAEARKNCGFNDKDLRPEECDPHWLCKKGESLLSGGSFIGAVSAFSTGIKFAPKMAEFYVGRAKAHFALGNLRKTVEDASQGLELLTPKVSQNIKQRLDCHQVRADAFRKLNMNQEALLDLQEAMSVDPFNDELKQILNVVRKDANDELLRVSSEEDQ